MTVTRVVIDSSVAVKWFVNEPDSPIAHQILDVYREGRLTMLAPTLIYAEVASIIWKKCVLQGMGAAPVQNVLDDFRLLDFETIPISELVDDALRLAVEHRRTVYDALYLALCQREQCPFVTSDERLVNAVKLAMPNVLLLSDWKKTRT